MKFLCICEHVIVDQTDYLPYKGEIMPDQSFFDFMDRVDEAIHDLWIATQENKPEEWIIKYFAEGYPRNLTNAQMLMDIFSRYYIPLTKFIYQCEECGRLWIQKDHTNQYIPFRPEDEKWEKVLEKVKKQ